MQQINSFQFSRQVIKQLTKRERLKLLKGFLEDDVLVKAAVDSFSESELEDHLAMLINQSLIPTKP